MCDEVIHHRGERNRRSGCHFHDGDGDGEAISGFFALFPLTVIPGHFQELECLVSSSFLLPCFLPFFFSFSFSSIYLFIFLFVPLSMFFLPKHICIELG